MHSPILAPLEYYLSGRPPGLDEAAVASWWQRVRKLFPDDATLAALYPTVLKGSTALPESDRARARDCYRMAAARHLLFAEAARQIARELEATGIRTVGLKGVDLAYSLHADPGARPSADLDLLVAPADFDRAVEVLARRGARPPMARKGRQWREDYVAWEIILENSAVPFELHWGLIPDDLAQVSMAEVLGRVRPLPEPAPIRWGLAWEDQAWYLPAHAVFHGMASSVIRFSDLWRLGRRLDELGVEPGVVAAVARRYGLARRLDLASRVYHRLWGSDWWRVGHLRRSAPWLTGVALRLGGAEARSATGTRLARRLLLAGTLDSWPKRARYGWRYARMKWRDRASS